MSVALLSEQRIPLRRYHAGGSARFYAHSDDFGFGWAFYSERLDIFVLLGALINVAGVLRNLRAESKRAY